MDNKAVKHFIIKLLAKPVRTIRLTVDSLISHGVYGALEMGKKEPWITPFKRQCFVTAGVSLNMAGHGLVIGFAAILLPQLRLPDTSITIDDTSGSWIASIMGFALILGNFIVPTIMAKYGRRTANLTSIAPMMIGWFCILTATNITTLLIARFLQGLAMGMSASVGPVLIGEYTSPNNRGAFLMCISLSIAAGVLIVHTLGSFFTWQITAFVIAFVVFVDLLIVLYSPESPSWLADQGRYDESIEVFLWLRGPNENDELKRMIEASKIINEAKELTKVSNTFAKRLASNLSYINTTIRKREFYKPIFIMIHIYTLGQWAGANVLSSYAIDIFTKVIGTEVNIPLMIITMDVQRIISNSMAIYVIKKVKRRTILFVTGGINLFAFLSIAGYVYCKERSLLPFDNPAFGIALIHIHMFSIATGTVPLPFIIAGEVFPLEYRSLAGGLSVLFLSFNLFITVKTVPFLFQNVGLYGAYVLYGAVVGYCLLVAGIFLPETKDRTLQEIEDEFRGRPLSVEELMSTQSLTSIKKLQIMDRRCSSPFL